MGCSCDPLARAVGVPWGGQSLWCLRNSLPLWKGTAGGADGHGISLDSCFHKTRAHTDNEKKGSPLMASIEHTLPYMNARATNLAPAHRWGQGKNRFTLSAAPVSNQALLKAH